MNKNITYLLVALLVIGGGYWYFTRNPAPATGTPSLVDPLLKADQEKQPTAPSPTSATPVTPPSTPTVSDDIAKQLPTIDDTWKTYTNTALNFQFQWPTKGRYAPTWDVAFADTDCVGTNDAPQTQKTTFTSPNGTSFCHVSTNEGAAGSFYLTDTFTTKKGSRYVVLTLTKKLTNAGALGCSFVNDYPYSTSATTCIPFDSAIYNAHLDQIVSTFKNTN